MSTSPIIRRWIDAALIAGSVVLVAKGQLLLAAPLLLLGLVMPARHWLTNRDDGGPQELYGLVPAEVAAAHAEIVAATPGRKLIESADNLLLEVAVVTAGRRPRGRAQERFVATCVQELRDHHTAWTAARAEVDAISLIDLPAEPKATEADGGVMVTVLVVILFPVFAAWDLVRGSGRAIVALVDGLALRLRAAGQLVVDAAKRCAAVRASIAAAVREARHRFIGVRLRIRVRLRGLR